MGYGQNIISLQISALRLETYLGVSENVVYPILPNGFADHYPVFKWLAIIGNINPTFSGPNPNAGHFWSI